MTGVFMTTDKNKEKTCVKDAYNILNEVKIFTELLKYIFLGCGK